MRFFKQLGRIPDQKAKLDSGLQQQGKISELETVHKRRVQEETDRFKRKEEQNHRKLIQDEENMEALRKHMEETKRNMEEDNKAKQASSTLNQS